MYKALSCHASIVLAITQLPQYWMLCMQTEILLDTQVNNYAEPHELGQGMIRHP
jgi:hypothetical protein